MQDRMFECYLMFASLCMACAGACAQGPATKNADTWGIDQMASQLTPTRVVVYKTVGKRELRLFIFDPKDSQGKLRPCFLSIHGGGWDSLSPHRQYPFASHFATRGMVGISVEYRLVDKGSGTTVFDCVKDARSAMRYVRSHAADLGIDPQKIVANGGSAGGHLAAGTAFFDGIDDSGDDLTVSCVPNALVLYSPVIDTSTEGYGNGMCGPRWQSISPLHRVASGAPPTIVFHGTEDLATAFAGAKAFCEAMHKAGNRCDLVVEQGAGHAQSYHSQLLYEKTLVETEGFLNAVKILPAQR